MSIVMRQNGEEWMIDLKRVMVWVMFSSTERLTVTSTEVFSMVGAGNVVSRVVLSESSNSASIGE